MCKFLHLTPLGVHCPSLPYLLREENQKLTLFIQYRCLLHLLYCNLPNHRTDLTVQLKCSQHWSQTTQEELNMLCAQCQDDLGPRSQTSREGVRLPNPILHFPTFWRVCSFYFPNAKWQGFLDLGVAWANRQQSSIQWPAVQHRGQEHELKK